jgi:hypothetical protein
MGRTSRFQQLDALAAKDALRDLLSALLPQLDLAIHSLTSGENAKRSPAQEEVAMVIFLMVQGIGVSIHSIVKLTADLDMGIRDCFGIARSVCEGALNVSYIIAGGEEVARRAKRHALQKSYRDLNRKDATGTVELRASSIPDVGDVPGLAEALAEFSRKNGSEVSEWSGLDLAGKQAAVAARFPKAVISFSASTMSIYRHASEILHGTYFGAEYYWLGSKGEPFSRDAFERTYVNNHLVAIFTAVFGAVHGMLEVIADDYDLPELHAAQAAWLMETTELMVPR